MIPDMVGHHNGIVYDYPERDSNSGQRIKMHLELKDVIKDERNEDIGNEADSDDKQVFEFPAYKKHKEKKQDYRKDCTENIL